MTPSPYRGRTLQNINAGEWRIIHTQACTPAQLLQTDFQPTGLYAPATIREQRNVNTYLLVLLLCRPGAEIPCGYDTIMVEVENIQTKAKCEAQAREFRKRNRKVYRGHFCTKETQLRI